jgi:hypothetical protein
VEGRGDPVAAPSARGGPARAAEGSFAIDVAGPGMADVTCRDAARRAPGRVAADRDPGHDCALAPRLFCKHFRITTCRVGGGRSVLLTEARRTARVSADGELVALDEQDRRAWDVSPEPPAASLTCTDGFSASARGSVANHGMATVRVGRTSAGPAYSACVTCVTTAPVVPAYASGVVVSMLTSRDDQGGTCVTNTGPKLEQESDLRPSYYIRSRKLPAGRSQVKHLGAGFRYRRSRRPRTFH